MSAVHAVATRLGTIRLTRGERGLRSARLLPGEPPPDNSPPTDTVLRAAVAWFAAYFRGEFMPVEVPLEEEGTPFQLRCWAALRAIPPGGTRTYAQQAAMLDPPGVARAVGAANGRNPLIILTPCHRIVGADGSLTGFSAGLDAKRWLLRHEARVAGRGVTLPLPGA